MGQQTQINGNRYSFTDLRVSIAGQDTVRGVFKSINYGGTKEPGQVQGNQSTLVGLTAGYGVGQGDFEMLVSEFDDLAKLLTSNGVYAITDIDFDITISYSANNVDVRTDQLRGCRISDVQSPNQQGTDATTKQCKMIIRRLTLNGIDLFADAA